MFRRYTHVRQNDETDCGAAALATLALSHGIPVGLEQMRDLAGTDRAGTNLWGLVQAAEKIGVAAKAVEAESESLSTIPLPAIAHITNEEGLGHFVVVHRVGPRSIVVSDPARGIQKLSRQHFEDVWTGCLLLAWPAHDRTHANGLTPPRPFQRLLSLLTQNRGFLVEAFCCAILMTVLGLSSSFFVQHLVDSVLVRHEVRLLNALGIGMLLVVVFRVLFGVIRQYLLAYISRKIDLTLIADYARHILRLPMNFFEMRQVGEIISRVNDAAKVREAISGTTLTLVVDGVLVIFSASVLWLYDAPLAMLATLFVPLLVGSVLVHHPAVKRRSRQAMENSARLSAHLVEDISGVETVKAYGIERDRTEEGESRLVRLVQDVFGLQSLGISMTGMGTFVTGIAGIAILWFGGHRVITGALSIGQLMFFSTLLGYMLGPLERLASVNLSLQDAMIAIDRLYQVMDIQIEPQADTQRVEFNGLRECIELDRVTFGYGCRDNVLESVDLSIPAGKTVAVVGESGSGKSTLLKLMLRFYDPTKGRIKIDGLDMRDYDLPSLRSRIGLVSQDPFIFSGTIRDNIAIGRHRATMSDVARAAAAAGLGDFISTLPDRFETVIGERGANLSGGQRQRLAIARALLREPDILIFDEATSHLDTATERAIQQSLRSELAGKTVILVAHRLSTIRHADVICVLARGVVVEQGSHTDLLQQDGRYAALWRAQDGCNASPEPLSVEPTEPKRTDKRINGHDYGGVMNHG